MATGYLYEVTAKHSLWSGYLETSNGQLRVRLSLSLLPFILMQLGCFPCFSKHYNTENCMFNVRRWINQHPLTIILSVIFFKELLQNHFIHLHEASLLIFAIDPVKHTNTYTHTFTRTYTCTYIQTHARTHAYTHTPNNFNMIIGENPTKLNPSNSADNVNFQLYNPSLKP